MKGLTVLLLVALPALSYAQGVFTNSTHSALQQVISDFPHHFKNIKGKQTSQDPQTTDFSSTVQIPGAVNTVITRYSAAANEEVYSWKSVLLETEEFDVAAKKYKELYNQIKNSIIKVEGEKPFILNGSYETPTDTKKFTTSDFYLLPAASGDLKKLKVEISLEFYVIEWKLTLLVYDQDEEAIVME